jgi:inosine-uridine nucleoside N-ribohydrolase
MSRLVHVDVDPGCDDAIMLAVALGHPAIELAGVSTVGGNTAVEHTTENALSILELFDRTDVPVARGAGKPLTGTFEYAEWVHGPDGLRCDLPEPTTEPRDTHGAEFIVEQARTHGDDLTIVAVAPMTNLATALVLEPALPEMVEDIYLMGGAAWSGGNATIVAEANFRNDPVAARRVFESAEPKMVGLEATYEATLPYSLVEEYADSGQPHETIGAWLDFSEDIRAMSANGTDPAIHDAAVMTDLIDDVLTYESYYVEVDASGGPADGGVLCDQRGVTENEPNADVAVRTDTEQFRSVVMDAFDRL